MKGVEKMLRLFFKSKFQKKRAEPQTGADRNEEFSAHRKVVRKVMVYRSYTMGRRLGYR
jgi:hypothetical protein